MSNELQTALTFVSSVVMAAGVLIGTRGLREDVRALHETLLKGRAINTRGAIPPIMRLEVMERCGYRCQYCGEQGDAFKGADKEPWHLEHVIPVVRGGPTHPQNLTLACATCNRRKGSMTAIQFMALVATEKVQAMVQEIVDARRATEAESGRVVYGPPDTQDEIEHIYETWRQTGDLSRTVAAVYGDGKDGAYRHWVRDAIQKGLALEQERLRQEGEAA